MRLLPRSRPRRLVLAVLVAATCAGLAVIGVRWQNRGTPRAQALPVPSAPTSPARQGRGVVVGLGDSVMAGTNCGCAGPAAAYASLMSRSTGRSVSAVNLGVPGATTSSLLQQLGSAHVRSTVAEADVVVVIIGANDLIPELDQFRASTCDYACYHPAIHAMATRLNVVLDRIADIRNGRRGTVLVSDYWNVFPDGSGERHEYGESEIKWSRMVSRDANTSICAVSNVNGAVCVDTYAPFFARGADPDRYLASDGDHPDKAGVALIARQLQKATPEGAF